MTSDLNTFTVRLLNVLDTDDAILALENISYMADKPWTRGGCFLLALALKRYFGKRATPLGLYIPGSEMGHEHAVIEIRATEGDRWVYIDGNGLHEYRDLGRLYHGGVLDDHLDAMARSEVYAPKEDVAYLADVLRRELGPAKNWK